MFMWLSLFNESMGWAYAIKGTPRHRLKQLYNNYERAALAFAKEAEKEINFEDVSEDSEVFSRCLELIHKAKTTKDKQVLYFGMLHFLVQYHEEQETNQPG